MSDHTVDCPFDKDVDIEARYLSGRLPEEEAEAFEAHYFECDRCFALMQRGAELRAAMASSSVRAHRRTPWWPSLAVAAGVILAAGLWRVQPHRTSAVPAAAATDSVVFRGVSGMLQLRASATDSLVVASWTPGDRARSYRVRLLGEDGSLLSEHEVTDTTARLVLPRRDAARAVPIYVEVQALDQLRDVVATSPIVRALQETAGP